MSTYPALSPENSQPLCILLSVRVLQLWPSLTLPNVSCHRACLLINLATSPFPLLCPSPSCLSSSSLCPSLQTRPSFDSSSATPSLLYSISLPFGLPASRGQLLALKEAKLLIGNVENTFAILPLLVETNDYMALSSALKQRAAAHAKGRISPLCRRRRAALITTILIRNSRAESSRKKETRPLLRQIDVLWIYQQNLVKKLDRLRSDTFMLCTLATLYCLLVQYNVL